MKIGDFNINNYLDKLYEEATAVDGGLKGEGKDGIIIPEENKKAFSWLKREYDKAKVEVKVEIKMGGSKFEPGYDLQTDLKSVKDFKPGMYGNDKTSNFSSGKKESNKDNSSEKNEKSEKSEKDNKPEKDEKTAIASKKISVKTDVNKDSKPEKESIKESSLYNKDESALFNILKSRYSKWFNSDNKEGKKHKDSSSLSNTNTLLSSIEYHIKDNKLNIPEKRLRKIANDWVNGRYSKTG